MYARLVRFAVHPGKQVVAQSIVDDIAPLIAAQPGFRSVAVFGDDDSGEYGLFVLWDSVDEANAAAQLVRPKLEGHLAGNLQRPPDIRLFNVLTFAEHAH